MLHAKKAQRIQTYLTLYLTSALDRGCWLTQRTQPALYPRERPGTHFIEGWVAPGPVWTGAENLATTGIRTPDRLSCSGTQAMRS